VRNCGSGILSFYPPRAGVNNDSFWNEANFPTRPWNDYNQVWLLSGDDENETAGFSWFSGFSGFSGFYGFCRFCVTAARRSLDTCARIFSSSSGATGFTRCASKPASVVFR
jgi:hypothetical protein